MHTGRLVVRDAGTADARALTAFARSAYADHYADLWSSEGLQRWLDTNYGADLIAAELADPARVRYLLCERSGALLGYGKVLPARPVPTHAAVTGLELEKVYVARAATGSGVGSALFERVLEFAQSVRESIVWLDVLRTNERGIRLYRRWGFEVVGEVPFATDRFDIGMYVMRRDVAGRG